MYLWEELKAQDKKGLFTSDKNIVSYPTGITVLDYANGYWATLRDENGKRYEKAMLGISAGSMVSVISENGGGKSTICTQIAWNIVKEFENGFVLYVDCEKTMTPQRIIEITGIDEEELDRRFTLDKNHVSIEEVLEAFNQICEVKEKNGKSFQYEVKGQSIDGKPFWQYVPTVFIIDSLPSFNGKDYNTEDLGNNIDQMKASKDITRFYTNVLDRAWRYNIIFLVINHIRPAANMNPYATPPRGLLMLNNAVESLPRGTVPQYFSNTYFRIKTKKSSNYTVEDDGFVGYKSDIILAKTKSNIVGTSFPVTFNSRKGFDAIYSLLEFAYDNGLIQGRNPNLRLSGFEERRFSRKEFSTLMTVDTEFREGFLTVLKPYFELLLGTKKLTEEESEIVDETNKEIATEILEISSK